jgi:1-acyl-sn-glycerol-3-phosphate acyltransferase
LSILGISWFWLYGALLLTQFPAYTRNVLGGSETAVTLLLATFTIGIGSLLCERLSAKQLEIGLVPFGSIGLTVFGLDMAWASPMHPPSGKLLPAFAFLAEPGMWRVLLDLCALGLFGGFFIVPLYALIQLRSSTTHRARIIAGNNIMNALFMVVGALAAAGLVSAGLTIPALFGVAAVCNAVVAIYIYKLVPEFLLRFVVWILIHSVYRLDKHGVGHIPDAGPAVLVCNHVSFVDALIITAACRRPIRFVMDHRVFRRPILSFVFKASRAIPIASGETIPVKSGKENAVLKKKAFDDVSQALAAGELVGIFPEGRVTEDGEISAFRHGIAQIVARNPVPVIPMALSGLWGSIFSRVHGAVTKSFCPGTRLSQPWKARPFRKVVLIIGDPVAPEKVTLESLRDAMARLRGQYR